MRDKRNKHRHGRDSGTFAGHRCRRGPDEVRSGRGWLFFDGAHRAVECFEPHFRYAARLGSLDGKHMRSVGRPVLATHTKYS